MPKLISEQLRNALLEFDEFNDDYQELPDFRLPKKTKTNVSKLKPLLTDLNATKTIGKLNSYTYTLNGTQIFFKPTSNPNVVELDLITTPKELRGQGSAKKALQSFLSAIDKNKLHVELSVVPRDKETTSKGLEGFYKQFGFTKTSDFEMYR